MSNSYHFNIGNSTSGHLGMCARVTADTRKQAVAILRDFLQACTDVDVKRNTDRNDAVEYCNVYINPDAVSLADINDDETEETDADKDG